MMLNVSAPIKLYAVPALIFFYYLLLQGEEQCKSNPPSINKQADLPSCFDHAKLLLLFILIPLCALLWIYRLNQSVLFDNSSHLFLSLRYGRPPQKAISRKIFQ